MADGFKIVVTGVKELDAHLEAIAAEDGPKSINAAMRKFLREAVKTIVLPKVLELVPVHEDQYYRRDGKDVEHGFLESQITVRAITRRRGSVGYWVGFPDRLFTGDTYYGGYIEFGWDHRHGFHVEADSFLRRALYPQANEIIAQVRARVAGYIAERNRAA